MADDAPAIAGLTLADRVAALEAENADVKARLAALEAVRRRSPSPQDAALLAALRRVFPARTAFWSTTVDALSATDETLALAVAGISRPGMAATVAVGRALKRLTDRPSGGAVVRRIGRDDHGVIWVWEDE